jgi:2-oxoglutarate ferredoxin oxidoreductase subunit gamma
LSRFEIRIAGYGGQGAIKAGIILAKALSLEKNKNVMQIESYGPEARGGACRAEIIVSDEEFDYPKVKEADVLVAMSQNAFNEYIHMMKEGGTVIVDPDTVPHRTIPKKIHVVEVPATDIAKQIGTPIVANIVLLGALTALTGIVKKTNLEKIISEEMPHDIKNVNLKAFRFGFKFIRERERKL